MPWNCLCSSDKERHKLEISAPILNRDGSAKIIQNPSNNGHSKKINFPYQRNANQEAIAPNNSLSRHDDSKLPIKTAVKQKQRSKKIVRNSKNPHAKFQSGEQQSSNPADTLNFINNTIDLNGNASLNHQRHEPQEDDATYSQVVFEREVNKLNEPSSSSANILSTNNLKKPTTNGAASFHASQRQDLDTGHYDRLPFDKSSSKPDYSSFQRPNDQDQQWPASQTHVHDQPDYQSKQNRTATGVASNGEGDGDGDTIPFIDEEDVVSIVEKHGTHHQNKEGNGSGSGSDYATTTRIITLNPRNIGSNQTIQRRQMVQRAQLSNAPFRKPRCAENVVIDYNANHEVGSRSTTISHSHLSNQNLHGNGTHGRVGVHYFIAWNSAKGKLCQVCHASALNGSNSVVKCRCCDLVCHLWCAPKIMKSKEDRADSSQQIQAKLETQPWTTQTLPPPVQNQKSAALSGLRLHYVTERILAYILPTQNGNHFDAHDQYEKEVIPMLEQKHGKNYQLFNLETCISVITLERICELCKHIDKWLGSGQEKVVVLQDREDCQRLGATIIAFLEYLRICASNYQTRLISQNDDAQAQNSIARNWMNLDMFSMKKFVEGNIEPLRIPSYKRYIRYFSGLLSGQIKLNASPLHLNSMSIESPPSWLQYNGVSSNSEWSSFIKIYEGLQCVYTSDIHIIPITTRQFLYQIGNLRLRGDILIRCYQIGSSDGSYDRESKKLMFSIQFHTCAIKTNDVVFVKEDLDYAHEEPQFPNDCKVSFHFNSSSNNNYLFQSPLIRTERLNDLDKANSIENLDLRPTLTSSVSPSSFPSQVSPQEDRHRELDDILSDMLLTVQDIPDFQNRKSSTHSINQYGRSQSVVSHVSATANASASSPVYTLPIPNPPAHNTNRELIHNNNSHSYVSQENVQRHSNSNSYKPDRFDPYDTASTTTTLTPPPSESGRDTPNLFSGYHSSTSNISLVQSRQQQQQPRRETSATMPLQHVQMNPQSASSAQANSQHQSATYQRVVRTSKESNPITSEDEDNNIPYHAREHSQPFTYGNLPLNGIHLNDVSGPDNQQKDPRMIKAQSGLTSPMLVRKTFGGGVSNEATYSTLRKPDFEEMLRERREKVMSEKYSISDKQPVASNGYHNYYNEPLKRSNTLDGFHRSTSTNELSGQTWLQLQQQKLRAKKNAQLKDDRKYFEEIHTEIKNRPLRSRNNTRYDGYASDTAAFDEVDYRRPLHVQTPYHTSNSSPERHYHTISSTTKTVTKERPFVAVRRSHETAKQDKLGVREESFSSYRSETDQDLSIAGSPRPETPAFPVTPRTPYGLHNGSSSPGIPPRSPTPQRRLYNSTWSLRSIKSTTSTLDRSKDIYGGTQKGLFQEILNQNDTLYRTRMNSNSSNANSEPQEVAPHLVKFVRDSSKFWYKSNLSREEAIDLLRNATPGTFIVRDSTTFKNAYGLVVRVAQPPPGVTAAPGSDELVRHFLVEPTTRGVRLKGCANEPVFSSLSALVYQHSITPLALPCRLIIPDSDIQPVNMHTPAQKQLLTQGAACNVLYLYSCGTESLTGEEAVRRAVAQLFSTVPLPKPTEVHFKVAQQGITLTDNTRQKFFRKHYTAHNISFCGTDPEHRQWSVRTEDGGVPVSNKTIFAFVARRSPSSKDNQCHVFCDLAVTQPATAIVSFANKVLPTEKQINRNI